MISGPNPAAVSWRVCAVFFRGSPRFLGGSPTSPQKCLGAPRGRFFGACGGLCCRLGFRIADLLIIVPAAGSCFFSKIVGATGGLLFLFFCSAPAAGSCFFIFFGACGGLLFSQNVSAPAAGSCFSFVSLSHLMSLPSLSRLGPPAPKN